jgi:hypothetical protein
MRVAMVEMSEAALVGAALTLEIEIDDWGPRIADEIVDAQMPAVAACPGQIGIADERGDSSVDLEN